MKKPSCTIAQAGFALEMWDLSLWCEKWKLDDDERRDLLEWFRMFHAKQMRKEKKRQKRARMVQKELDMAMAPLLPI